jgi:vacuolar-type H+-ATPase subunit H
VQPLASSLSQALEDLEKKVEERVQQEIQQLDNDRPELLETARLRAKSIREAEVRKIRLQADTALRKESGRLIDEHIKLLGKNPFTAAACLCSR